MEYLIYEGGEARGAKCLSIKNKKKGSEKMHLTIFIEKELAKELEEKKDEQEETEEQGETCKCCLMDLLNELTTKR